MFVDLDGKVIVDPASKKPVTKVNGEWKTIRGYDKEGNSKYGEVSKKFIEGTQPVLERMTASKTGTKLYEAMQAHMTKIITDTEDAKNNRDKGNENSLMGPCIPGDYPEEGNYDMVVITPFLDNIESSASADGVSADEKLLQTMTVEFGHVKQVELERSVGFTEIYENGNMENYEKVYTPLLNEAIKVGKEYRQENGMPIDKSSNIPVDKVNNNYGSNIPITE